MPLKSNTCLTPLTGGFRYGHSDFSMRIKAGAEARTRLGTTVSVSTYEELARLADRHQLRLSEILVEATASGLIANAVEALIK